MRYITIEIQNNADGSASFPYENKIKAFDDKNKAESEFHRVLQYAAISTAPSKGCVLLTSTGELLRSEFYEHPVAAPEPEPEPETQEETPAE